MVTKIRKCSICNANMKQASPSCQKLGVFSGITVYIEVAAKECSNCKSQDYTYYALGPLLDYCETWAKENPQYIGTDVFLDRTKSQWQVINPTKEN